MKESWREMAPQCLQEYGILARQPVFMRFMKATSSLLFLKIATIERSGGGAGSIDSLAVEGAIAGVAAWFWGWLSGFTPDKSAVNMEDVSRCMLEGEELGLDIDRGVRDE